MKIGFYGPGFIGLPHNHGVACMHAQARGLLRGFMDSGHEVIAIGYPGEAETAEKQGMNFRVNNENLANENLDVLFAPSIWMARHLNAEGRLGNLPAKITAAYYDWGWAPRDGKESDEELSKRLNVLFVPSEGSGLGGRSYRPNVSVVPVGYGLPYAPKSVGGANPYKSTKNLVYGGRIGANITPYLNEIAKRMPDYTLWLCFVRPQKEEFIGYTLDEFRRVFPHKNIKMISAEMGISFKNDGRYGPLAFDAWWDWKYYADAGLAPTVTGNVHHIFAKCLSYWWAGCPAVLPNNYMNVIYVRPWNGRVHDPKSLDDRIVKVREAAVMPHDRAHIMAWAQETFSWSNTVAPRILRVLEHEMEAL